MSCNSAAIGYGSDPTADGRDRGAIAVNHRARSRPKAYDYRRIPSVHEMALVASEQRYVETWRRRGPKWEAEDLIGDATLELETMGVRIPFAAIYADSGL
jgi:hypothetical protein